MGANQDLVLVFAQISADGQVLDAKPLDDSFDTNITEAAINALRAVKWNPAKRDNKPVKAWVAVTLRFNE